MCSVVSPVQTNIVMVKMHEDISPAQFCDRMKQVTDLEAQVLGGEEDDLCIVRMMPFQGNVRMVTHADVSREEVCMVIKKLKYVIDEFDRKPALKEIISH